ncbi:MAG: hypothetical protein JETCAE03_35900 [Ignavibacteriaceae bacterium]|jgi:hypothetical protein|nr:MAG: hypothetical protein JETCAE03_35900 [Ignavibacteriaceae bacterium]
MTGKQEEKFGKLAKLIVDEIEKIDKETPNTLGTVEPEWWLDMMELKRKAIECKMKYLKYEI